MKTIDDPMVLCKDCGHRAEGMKTRKPFDGTDECEWCGSEVEGSKQVVERQEDPGPTEWQAARDEILEWLQDHEHTSDVRGRDRTVDFTIGNLEDWPDYMDDEQLNAIRSSSISVAMVLGDADPFDETKMHLPPTEEELRQDVEDSVDLPDEFGIHFGTGALGGLPAPDGVITPHVLSTDNVGREKVRGVVEQLLQIYEDVYDEGQRAIKYQP